MSRRPPAATRPQVGLPEPSVGLVGAPLPDHVIDDILETFVEAVLEDLERFPDLEILNFQKRRTPVENQP